jgi:hypothetical protein
LDRGIPVALPVRHDVGADRYSKMHMQVGCDMLEIEEKDERCRRVMALNNFCSAAFWRAGDRKRTRWEGIWSGNQASLSLSQPQAPHVLGPRFFLAKRGARRRGGAVASVTGLAHRPKAWFVAGVVQPVTAP